MRSEFSIALVLTVFLAGCVTTSPIDPPVSLIDAPDEYTVNLLLRENAETWLGTPHVLGGFSDEGIDCSALVQAVYRDVFSVDLPRTTSDQVKLGRPVSARDLQAGDLVFYRIGLRSRHVGIYLSDKEFLHASESEGVTISNLEQQYWRERMWKIRRVLNSQPDPIANTPSEADSTKTPVGW